MANRKAVQVQLVNNRAMNRWYVGFIREPAANFWTYSRDYMEPSAASIARLAQVANARAKAGVGHVNVWPTGWDWRLYELDDAEPGGGFVDGMHWSAFPLK